MHIFPYSAYILPNDFENDWKGNKKSYASFRCMFRITLYSSNEPTPSLSPLLGKHPDQVHRKKLKYNS